MGRADVFACEKLYRFTPFSQDAQPSIRGKSPLQPAGYDIAGLSIMWPMQTGKADHVPNRSRQLHSSAQRSTDVV